MAIIARLLPVGGTALDLGANFGLYARFLAEMVGKAGEVHSVEPVPSTFDVLQSNIQSLGLRQVKTYHRAISDSSGTVTMVVPQYATGGSNYYEARIVSGGVDSQSQSVRVTASRVDELFASLSRIDFVKCDVEGHELAVLRGASRILQLHRPAWMIEVSGNPDDRTSSAHEVVKLLTKHGYQSYTVEGDSLRTRQVADRAVNYFFLRPEHIARLI